MKQTPESQPLTVAGRLYEVGSEADFPELVAGFVAVEPVSKAAERRTVALAEELPKADAPKDDASTS